MLSCIGTTSKVPVVSAYGGRNGLLVFKSFSSSLTSVRVVFFFLPRTYSCVLLTTLSSLRVLCLIHLLHINLFPMDAQLREMRWRGIRCLRWNGNPELIPSPLHLVLSRNLQEDRKDWKTTQEYREASCYRHEGSRGSYRSRKRSQRNPAGEWLCCFNPIWWISVKKGIDSILPPRLSTLAWSALLLVYDIGWYAPVRSPRRWSRFY